jgi:pimeloyl-ACP methyl ester carboxylesterase
MRLSWFAMPLAAALAVTVAALSPAAAGGETIKLQTRPGVSVEFRYIGRDDATAAVILSEGGGGGVNLRSASEDNGILSRHRDRFAKHGFAVALMNAPPDRKKFKGGMSPKFRRTKKHVQDVDAVVGWMKQKTGLPVWLIGVSNGTVTASFYAIHGNHDLAGAVLLSSITEAASSKVHKSIVELGLDRVRVPVLVLAHKKDGCKHTPPSGAARIVAALTASPNAKSKIFSGGRTKGGDPCLPRSYHTFYGIEGEVVAAIADFIKANTAVAAAAAAQPAASGETLPGAEIERLLVGNTIVFPTPQRGNIFTYFEPGGATLVGFEKKPGRVLNKTWWIDGKDMLCRTVGKKNRETCAKITALGGNAIKFLSPEGDLRFEATLLEGRQLPE